MCVVCIANKINRNVYMYLITRIFPTTGYARVLLFMFIRRELGGTGIHDVYFSLHTVLLGSIIALKASGRDCTNNNELHHKIGVLQRYAMQLFVFTSELLQAIRWRSKSNGCTPRN